MLLILFLSACQPNSEKHEVKKNMDRQLIESAEQGNTEQVRQLLQSGANIDATDEQGRTAVMAATYRNHVDTVDALIQAGADINIRDHQLNNVFLYAGAEGMLDILRLAIDADADVTLTNRFGGTALIPASDRGHVEIVQELLTRTSVDVNHINNLNWTALLEAVILGDGSENYQRIVKLLLDHGADPELPDGNGVTSLQHARERGYQEIERILMEAAN
ncbi:ankyrin repeat domain-containing protein [Paenibacillus sp. JNUCC32]|uniref:ankyrin repeat domain-containing protein n=1 Tax=Paenibacillus sp. JNUCC32 TaxID=2777984 RepID=UPI0017881A8D|nr:ankyrin repeat domain-containing protein [Paenibacillus sp. JNUCC-32]QOT13395.1 ankyrin repeat domain-containing protein [Paenibacillus sp. JNUCC-32]